MVFNFVVLYEVILVFVIRHSYRVPFFSNIWVWASVFLSISLQALIMYTPLYKLFKVVPLTFREILIVLAGGLFVWVASIFYYNIVEPLNNRKKNIVAPDGAT